MSTFVTPLQFSTVQPNLYRGSYPREINLPFIETLNLKNVISLTPKAIDSESDGSLTNFCNANNINLIHIQAGKVKVPKDKSKKADKPKVKRKQKAVPIEYDTVIQCIRVLIDKNNYPCYIHGATDNDMITSLIVACLRKLSFWSNIAIINEYLTYNSSINIHERNFIENFNSEITIDNTKLKDKVPWIHMQSITNTNKTLPKLVFEQQ
ncbi:hypothetical protein Kpol_526p24 [Vanderwaltozyma polyspora DSM 70294]|uniref:Tyrosine-protein phosphatase OCA6 n=1 Tax=Vanderwaltozyma polyspora (strain ATCC 22028 / DSM 70294 / BCRC 21397 / CBS 2163 / NBRC 10782 / NRRL Y-8283 / UCD 57-17) TaxID=436907 RepID=A7TLS9_VANPO|nr:uncharacterized protein Kpol_526p24 [Vanderwaltozyma polyspora DSM 70294]EDO16771.1 hypothetical protein Kpol_526p24 [Vanderwaltozyma polyspora DSM 70294]